MVCMIWALMFGNGLISKTKESKPRKVVLGGMERTDALKTSSKKR